MFFDGASVLYCKEQYEVDLGSPEEFSLRETCKDLSAKSERASTVNNGTFDVFAVCATVQHFLLIFMMRQVPTSTHEMHMVFILYKIYKGDQTKHILCMVCPPTSTPPCSPQAPASLCQFD